MRMENKLPDDNLEEFLRNSFNQYKENPPDRVWDRIDNSLNTTSIPKHSNYKRLFYPIAATLLLATITFLIYSNYKLKNKLNAALSSQVMTPQEDSSKHSESQLFIEKSIESNSENINLLMETQSRNQTTIGPIANSSDKIEKREEAKVVDHFGKIATDNPGLNELQTELKHEVPKNEHSFKPDKPGAKARLDLNRNSAKNSEKNPYDITNNNTLNTKPVNKSKSKANTTTKDDDQKYLITADDKINPKKDAVRMISNENNMEVPNQIIEESRSKPSEKFYVSPLSSILTILPCKENISRFVSSYPVNGKTMPAKATNASEMGVFVGSFIESGKIVNELGGHPGMPKIKSTNEFKTNTSWQIGLALNKSISKNLYFTSGLGYKQLNTVNDIKETILFGSRRPKPGGMPFQHDFPFKIKSNAGTSDIVISTEQLDQRASFNDNQPMEINVRTEFELNYLSIPVGFQYRYTKNKFFAGIGLGLNFDILLASTAPLTEVKMLNNLLKPIEQPGLIKLNQTKEMVLNAKANLVMGYEINKNLKFIISPELYLPISNRTLDRNGKIETNSWGIQAGIAYNLN